MTKVAFNERVNALAEKYWSLKKDIDADEADGKRRELEEIEKLLEKGITGRLRLELEEKASELRAITSEREGAYADISEVISEILELTSDFAPSLDQRKDGLFPYDSEHEPISKQYFKAITDILFNKPKPKLEFKDADISTKGVIIKTSTASNLAAFSSLNYVTTILQESAKKMLGRANQVDLSWQRLKEKDYAFIVFNVLIDSNSALSLKELQGICDIEDEEYKDLVTDMYDKRLREGLEYLVGEEWDYPLVERHGNKYEVTDLGRWVWMLCGGEAAAPAEEEKSKIQQIIKFIRKYHVDKTKRR
ncbi:MAG: hypothetical protein QMC78_06200 [Methanocellales archaeon]|nr:hypothetical protein [Methanocellales archaeon]